MKNIYDYLNEDWNRPIIRAKNEMIQHKSKRIKSIKMKSKQQAGTKFMWHKQN
jgi:hypothetical protein